MKVETKIGIFAVLGIVIGLFADPFNFFDYFVINFLITTAVFVIATYYIGFNEIQKTDNKVDSEKKVDIRTFLSVNKIGIYEVTYLGYFGAAMVTIPLLAGIALSSGIIGMIKVGFGGLVIVAISAIFAIAFGCLPVRSWSI